MCSEGILRLMNHSEGLGGGGIDTDDMNAWDTGQDVVEDEKSIPWLGARHRAPGSMTDVRIEMRRMNDLNRALKE